MKRANKAREIVISIPGQREAAIAEIRLLSLIATGTFLTELLIRIYLL